MRQCCNGFGHGHLDFGQSKRQPPARNGEWRRKLNAFDRTNRICRISDFHFQRFRICLFNHGPAATCRDGREHGGRALARRVDTDGHGYQASANSEFGVRSAEFRGQPRNTRKRHRLERQGASLRARRAQSTRRRARSDTPHLVCAFAPLRLCVFALKVFCMIPRFVCFVCFVVHLILRFAAMQHIRQLKRRGGAASMAQP